MSDYMWSLNSFRSQAAVGGDDVAGGRRRREREEDDGLDNYEDWFSLVLRLDEDEDGDVVGSRIPELPEGQRAYEVAPVSQIRWSGEGEGEEPAVPFPTIQPHRPGLRNVHFPNHIGSISSNAASDDPTARRSLTPPPAHASRPLVRPVSPPVPRRGFISRVVGILLRPLSFTGNRAALNNDRLNDGASSGEGRSMRRFARGRSVRLQAVPIMPAPLATNGQQGGYPGNSVLQAPVPLHDQWLPTHDSSGRSVYHVPQGPPAQSTQASQPAARHWYIMDMWFPGFRRTGHLPPFPPSGQLDMFWGVPFPWFREWLPAWDQLSRQEKAWVMGRVLDYVQRAPTDLRAKWALDVLQTQWWMDMKRKVGEDFCGICQEGYVLEDRVTFGPCRHVFHLKCEKEWLMWSSTCPMCRRDFAALATMANVVPDDSALAEAISTWMST